MTREKFTAQPKLPKTTFKYLRKVDKRFLTRSYEPALLINRVNPSVPLNLHRNRQNDFCYVKLPF